MDATTSTTQTGNAHAAWLKFLSYPQSATSACRNHGCNRLQCVLCKHNPNKRCTGNFAHKYWVGDKLLAKCEGEIQVEVVDGTTGERVVEDLSDMKVEVWENLAFINSELMLNMRIEVCKQHSAVVKA